MITVSLFSGCGGLDYGFEAAGCNIVVQNDFDKYSCMTLRRNNTNARIFEAPIEEISTSEFKRVTGNSVDIVIGGPPCQPFSKSAYWTNGDTRRLEDPRAKTLGEYFRIIQDLRPKAFLLENVNGISYSGKEEGFVFILNKIREINEKTGTNYHPEWKVLNAADYGVPQRRVRFILVALRDGVKYQFPEPTHKEKNNEHYLWPNMNKKNYTTAWDAIGDIKPDENEKLDVGGKWGNLLPSIPEGENYLWHTNKKGGLQLFGWRTHYWCFLLKLAKNHPSWTIQAQPGSAIGPFHWHNRKLSWKEMAAIQTFPKGFRIEGSRSEIQRQIGNAVPSLLSEVLARSIINQVTGKVFQNEPRLSIQASGKCPFPEAVEEVSEEYLYLIGDHPAHSGKGKGRIYKTA
jgi:DNA (cytosine-5)-methyltransferase 1